MITLYWAPKTRASRALWMLEETGTDYSIELVDIRAEDRKDSALFRAASPMGKVPALVDGDVQLAESAAICLYLADRYSLGELAPALDDPRRGRYLYWSMFTPAVAEPAMAEKFSGAESNRVSHGWGDFGSMLETLEQGLSKGPWILGERFSAADVMLGSSVVFMRLFGILPESVALADYADRCLARPAYRSAMAKETD
ncbi:MAG: glutathione S-transferase family protein [Pseudomonadota bacterium]